MLSTIKLQGELERRFEEIKTQLADPSDHEPSNEEVIGILMAEYSSDASDSSNDALVKGLLDD